MDKRGVDKHDNRKNIDLGQLWGPAFKDGSHGFLRVPIVAIGLMKGLGLSPNEVLVVLALQSFRRDLNTHPFPSTQTLSELIGMNRQNLDAVLKKLVKRSLLKITPGSKGRGHSNSYDVSELLMKMGEAANQRDLEEGLRASSGRAGAASGAETPKPENKASAPPEDTERQRVLDLKRSEQETRLAELQGKWNLMSMTEEETEQMPDEDFMLLVQAESKKFPSNV